MRISIWRSNFWKLYWTALRRSLRDRRARGVILKVSAVLVVCLLWFVISLPFLPLALLCVVFYIPTLLLRRLLLPGDFIRNEGPGASPEVRRYLEERASIIASLLARGGSEIGLKHATIAPGTEVITRQIQNKFLKDAGLWTKLERPELDLVSCPDGAWTAEHRGQVTSWSEQLRLLRWTLRIDAEITPLALFPKVDYSMTREFFRRNKVRRSSGPLVSVGTLEEEKTLALHYMARIFAEMNGRGMVSMDGDVWEKIRNESAGPSRDYFVGAETVGELSEDSLNYFGALTSARERYASYLLEQLKAQKPVSYSEWKQALEASR